MDQLRSLLSIASWAPAPEPEPVPEPDRAEDIAIQQALDEVLEYHRTHRPKNTTKNYEPSQSLGGSCTEQLFRTQLCFLFGNSMLLRLSNRLPMELPDLFSMPLPNE